MVALHTATLLFAAGAAAGIINSVAGGGSFVVFPSLLVVGVPPVAANATSAVALWPAGVASTIAYRKDLKIDKRTMIALGLASAVGGTFGALLLLATSDRTFTKILPLLMLVASFVFTLGPRFSRGRENAQLPLAIGTLVHLTIATYGGYFGGGMGFLMLATFTLMGMTHLHAMNGLKALLGVLINGAANIAFLAAHKVAFDAAVPMATGAMVGGFVGASVARRIAPHYVRGVVLVFAWALTAWFCVSAVRG